MEQLDKLLKELTELSKRECWSDDEDFNPYDQSGGNYDDAYSGGYDDGQAELARTVLSVLSNINKDELKRKLKEIK